MNDANCEATLFYHTLQTRYRALNSGKFPTPSGVRKEVGGCYYTSKKFVQELQYQSRRSPTSIRDENMQQDITEGFKSSNDSDIPSIEMTVHENIHQNFQTRDANLLVREAANGRNSPPDLELVRSSQIYIDGETHEDTKKGKQTLLTNKLCGEDESTEVEKVSRVQATVDARIHKDAGFKSNARTSLKKEPANKNKSSAEAEEVLFSQKDQTSADNDVDSDFFKANDELTSNFVEKAILDEKARPSATGDTAEEIKVKRHGRKEEPLGFHSSSDKGQNNLKQKSVSKDTLEVDRVKPGAELPHWDEPLHQAEKPETFSRNLSKEHGEETEPRRKSFMWENLKSFASGIVNIWKRL